jgi:hypothetical protein
MSAASAGEWVHLASAFLGQHVDENGKKIPFTACFNPALEAFIVDEAVPLEWRFLLWLYRQSWGNYSDFAVRDKGDSVALGQKDAAADLGADKQRISEIVAYWRALGYLRPGTARALYPADSGIHPQKVRHVPDFKRTQGEDFRTWWKVRYAEDFEAWEVHRPAYFRLIKVRAAAVKEYEALRTADGPILIEEESKIIKESSSSFSLLSEETTTTNPDPAPADFHSQHVATWQDAGKDGVPTPKQSAAVLRSCSSRSQEFLRWLAPKLPRVRHPGALKELTKEFLQTNTGPPMQPAAPGCSKCGGSLENGCVDGRCFNCAVENLPCLRE